MNIKVEQAKREDGFTLIELLVVVIIIGILAAIAIPVFLNQRDNAREAAVQSTLRSAATYMEIVYTDLNDYTTADEDALEDEGFRSGANVNILNVIGTATGYCIDADHEQNDAIVWNIDSDTGTPAEGACT